MTLYSILVNTWEHDVRKWIFVLIYIIVSQDPLPFCWHPPHPPTPPFNLYPQKRQRQDRGGGVPAFHDHHGGENDQRRGGGSPEVSQARRTRVHRVQRSATYDFKSCQSSGAVWKSRWPSWVPVPNKPTVSVDVKRHSTNNLYRWYCVALGIIPWP